MCQVWQVLLRDPEEVLTHLLMHGHAFSSSAALLIHSSGMHPSCSNWWAGDLGLWTCKTYVPSPCSAHTLPLEISYLSFLLIFPAVLTRVTIRQPLLSACISPALPRPPTQPCGSLKLLCLQQGGHGGAASPSTLSEFTPVFQTPGCLKHTRAYCSHSHFSPPKPKASKLISLAAHNRKSTPLCLSARTHLLLLALPLKQQCKAPDWRPRVKIIWSGFRSRLPPKPELA